MAEIGFKLLFVFGITNLIFLLMVAFSCRCVGLFNWAQRWFSNSKYQKFYSWHCYYWYGFFISVIAHTVLAFYLFGWPF